MTCFNVDGFGQFHKVGLESGHACRLKRTKQAPKMFVDPIVPLILLACLTPLDPAGLEMSRKESGAQYSPPYQIVPS